eukprot:6461721-Amphidinium_carterae.2
MSYGSVLDAMVLMVSVQSFLSECCISVAVAAFWSLTRQPTLEQRSYANMLSILRGLALLVAFLVLDGFTSSFQEKLFKDWGSWIT